MIDEATLNSDDDVGHNKSDKNADVKKFYFIYLSSIAGSKPMNTQTQL